MGFKQKKITKYRLLDWLGTGTGTYVGTLVGKHM